MRGILFLCLLSCHILAPAQKTGNDFSLQAPDSLHRLDSLSLWATQYYIYKFNSSGSIPILDINGQKTGLYADSCDFCHAMMEGTAYVKDSTGKVIVINVEKGGKAQFINCKACQMHSQASMGTTWSMTEGYGLGVRNFRLQPFRTIAVDKTVIPYGTVLFIPELKGKTMVLPDSSSAVHDGYVFAGDAGSAIKGIHIDVFTGTSTDNPFPGLIASNSSGVFKAYMVTDVEIINSMLRLHQ